MVALFGVMFVVVTRAESVADNIRRIAAGVNVISQIPTTRPLKALGFALKPNDVIANN